MNTPSLILQAFAPESEPLTCTMQSVLLLEAVSSPLLTGGTPSFQDIVAAHYILSQPEAALAARKAGTLDAAVLDHASALQPAQLTTLSEHIAAALTAAFASTAATAAYDADPEKKSSNPPA